MIADTAEALLIVAIFTAVLAGNLWNAQHLHHKHQTDGEHQ